MNHWTKNYKYQDWGYLFDSEATELSFLVETIIARNSLRYTNLLDEV